MTRTSSNPESGQNHSNELPTSAVPMAMTLDIITKRLDTLACEIDKLQAVVRRLSLQPSLSGVIASVSQYREDAMPEERVRLHWHELYEQIMTGQSNLTLEPEIMNLLEHMLAGEESGAERSVGE